MTKTVGISSFVVLVAFVLFTLSYANSSTVTDTSCDTIAQALADHGKMKPGMKRRDVERSFRQGGGMGFRFTTTYVYSKCEYIHVDVEFERGPDEKVGPDAKGDFPGNDIVKKVSEPILRYPARD